MSLSVSELAIYPVKSVRGLALREADLVDTGFRHDRAWMLIDDGGSFLSQRQHPSMALIEVVPASDRLRLALPGGETFDVPIVESGPALEAQVWGHRCVVIDQGPEASHRLSRYLGRSCRLVRMAPGFRRELSERYRREGDGPVGFADSMPFLLTSNASLSDLNSRLSRPVSMNRFRPNIVVQGGTPFQEDGWHRLRIGAILFRVAKKCLRCEIINIDPANGQKDIEPMESLEDYRSGPTGVAFGVNLVHEERGTLRIGDEIEVLE